MAANRKAEAPRRFPASEAARIAEELGRRWGQRVELEPLGGYLGRNQVFAAAWRGRPVVLKLFHHQPLRRRWREAGVAAGLAGAGLPVAGLLDQGRFEDGAPWICLERLPGEILEPLKAELPPGGELYADIGRLCARMHAFPASRLTGVSRLDKAGKYRRSRDKLLSRDLPEAGLFRAAAAALEAAETPRGYGRAALAHGDFSTRNILVERTDGGARITGLVDFELAHLGDPMEDIAKFAFKEFGQPGVAAAFMRGYDPGHGLGAAAAGRLRYHLVGLALDVCSWSRTDDPAFYAHATHVLEAVLDGDPAYGLP